MPEPFGLLICKSTEIPNSSSNFFFCKYLIVISFIYMAYRTHQRISQAQRDQCRYLLNDLQSGYNMHDLQTMISEECRQHREEHSLQVALVSKLAKYFQKTIGVNVQLYKQGDEKAFHTDYKPPQLDLVIFSFRIRLWVQDPPQFQDVEIYRKSQYKG